MGYMTARDAGIDAEGYVFVGGAAAPNADGYVTCIWGSTSETPVLLMPRPAVPVLPVGALGRDLNLAAAGLQYLAHGCSM